MGRNKPNDEEIIKLYVIAGLSGRRIAAQMHHSLTTIQYILKKYNLTRNLKQARANLFQKGYKHPLKKDFDEKRIIELYAQENKSTPVIAKLFNCSLGPILKILKKNQISIKSLGEFHKGQPGFWAGKKRLDISARLMGIKRSEETKKKLRLSHLGKISAIKGRNYQDFYGLEKSNQLKKKMRDSHLGIPSYKKGWTLEQAYGEEKARELKNKISERVKNYFSSEKARKAQSERIKNFFKNNPQAILKNSQIQKEYNQKHPEKVKKQSESMKRLYKDPTKRKSLSENLKKFYKEHPEALARMSEASKKVWSTPEKKEYARQRRFKQKFPFKHTLPERLVFDEMQARGIKFEKHQTVLNLCQPDAVINNMKIALFVDGDYWHAHPEKYKNKKLNKAQIDKIRRDKEQNELLGKDNWIILRFWESDIKKDVKKCVDKIEEAIKLNQ